MKNKIKIGDKYIQEISKLIQFTVQGTSDESTYLNSCDVLLLLSVDFIDYDYIMNISSEKIKITSNNFVFHECVIKSFNYESEKNLLELYIISNNLERINLFRNNIINKLLKK